MKLQEYLDFKGLSPIEMARELDCSPSTVTRILKGQRRPDNATLAKILDKTGGLVTPNDFFGVPGGPSVPSGETA